MAAILEVQNLKKVFTKANGSAHTAVNGISFSLNEGEIFSFLGPNGAGKSTTINMITTQLTPTEGTVKVDGIDIKDNPAAARQKIGIVAQHNNLDRGLTALENLVYHGQYYGMDKASANNRALELLKDFGLFDWKDDYVKSFSGGMAQRLKIARAIMHRPKLLLLDEPTTGLDPAYREILWDHVLKLNKENKTTVFLTTHYMEEPERFSDRVAIYNNGEIKALGTIDELRTLVPTTNIIYLTLDHVPDNFVETLESDADVKQVVQADHKSLTVYPENHQQVLNKIINLVDTRGISLENIQLSSTSLEDIYIHLTDAKEGA
jgi:ABC-2 type transport system ATP-binding protein